MVAPPTGAREWLKLVGIWVFLISAIALRGGGAGTSPFAACSWEYWSITGCCVGALLLVGWCCRHPDISALKCFGAGMLSSIVGIGGGLVLNPMLLTVGIDAMRTTATVSVMMLMICTSATFAFALSGALPLLPMAVLTSASFVGSLCGKSIVAWLVARTGRTSILVFMLVAFMAFSGSIIVVQGVLEGVRSAESGTASAYFAVHLECPSD
mmetsp:Transcript_34581/g.98377  ORF Transcript_34581/g.98377 Transcript_34581/m.98377 type:complete len:211 (+) Transcript_34581:763-1395(+)